jgi:hypothetical protein
MQVALLSDFVIGDAHHYFASDLPSQLTLLDGCLMQEVL